MNPIFGFLSGILGGENGPLNKLIGLIPDVNARALAKAEFEKQLLEATVNANLGQLEINKVEAASSSLFVAGWRPSVGWVCSFALAYQFVLQPIIGYGLTVFSTYSGNPIPPIPTLDTGSLMTVLMAMLGLGGMRTFEKVKGVERNDLTK